MEFVIQDNLITPEAFKAAFLKIIKYRQEELFSPWDDKTRYTQIMLGGESSLFGKMAAQLGFRYCTEYWFIDAVYYTEADQEHPHVYAKGISAAIEHEIDRKSIYNELYKLTIINTPLRVLVTYPASRGDSDEAGIVDYCNKIVRGADILGDSGNSRHFLIVLGCVDNPEPNQWRWRFFKFGASGFTEL